MRIILGEGLYNDALCLAALPAVKFLMSEECQARKPLRVVESDTLKTVSLLTGEDFQCLVETWLTSPLRFRSLDGLLSRNPPTPAVF